MPPKKKKIEQEQEQTAEIKNWYEHMPSEFLDVQSPNPNYYLHKFNIPFRAVVVAPSGSGKSNFVTNLIHLFCKDSGTFSDITIVCKDKEEPLYKFLQSKSDSISVKEGIHNLPQLDKYDKSVAHLVICDDLQLDKDQSRIEQFYIRARKKNVSIMYLAQNYYQIPKVVRNNCSYLIILKVSGQREIAMIMKEQGLGLTKDQLLNMYDFATHEKFSPLIIDVEQTDKNLKFRKSFNLYLNPAEFI